MRSYTDGGEHYEGQIGSEATPAEYLAAMGECLAEWARVLKPSGSLFLNLGDKYSTGNSGDRNTGLNERWGNAPGKRAQERSQIRSDRVPGMPPKSLLGLPWRVALAAIDAGWILRRDIIWSKPNGLPESVTDRCRSSHEYVFHLVRQPRYYAAVDEIREPHTGNAHASGPRATHQKWISGNGAEHRKAHTDPDQFNPLGKLPGSVWSIPSAPLTVPAHLGVDHFAAFPAALVRPLVLGWSPPGICVECGQGRRPVVERRVDFASGSGRSGRPPRGKHEGSAQAVSGSYDIRMGPVTSNKIIGYACACGEDVMPDGASAASSHRGHSRHVRRPPSGGLPPTRPAVVLDPFGGTGTTALVATVHGRTGITIDRSADYCRLARWRVNDPGERARALGVPKPPPVPADQEPLFSLADLPP